ncbi:MAG: ArsR/SmtB family transcription factor [Spirochaetales bacterium]
MARETPDSQTPNAERVFKALGNETRLRIVHMLSVSGKALCVCEMVDALQMPEYQVSRHLAALKKAGLVQVEKHGTWAYHTLAADSAFDSLWTFVDAVLHGAPFDEDARMLERRLELRAGDYCVVGFVSGNDLSQSHTARR